MLIKKKVHTRQMSTTNITCNLTTRTKWSWPHNPNEREKKTFLCQNVDKL